MATRRTSRRASSRVSRRLRSNARPIKIDEEIVDVTMRGITNALREIARLDKKRKPGDPGVVKPNELIFYLPWQLHDVAGKDKRIAIALFALPLRDKRFRDLRGLQTSKVWVDRIMPGLLGSDEESAVLLFERFSDDAKGPRSWASISGPKNLAEIRATLEHEIVHATDVAEPVTRADLSGSEASLRRYYNDWFELRAHMSDTLNDIRSAFAEKLRSTLGKGTPLPRAVGEALDFSLGKSETWRRMDRYLTPRSRNLILKGLVTALEDEGIITVE